MNQRPLVVPPAGALGDCRDDQRPVQAGFKPARLLSAIVLVVLLASACSDSPVAPSPTPIPKPTPTPTPTVTAKTEYTLTFTASPSCSFPAGIEKRVYAATVTEWSDGSLGVSLSDAEFMQGSGYFSGTRSGDTASFDIGFGWGYGVVEIIDHTKALFYDGTARTTTRDGQLSGTYSGRMALFDSQHFSVWERAPYDCGATDHKIEFARR